AFTSVEPGKLIPTPEGWHKISTPLVMMLGVGGNTLTFRIYGWWAPSSASIKRWSINDIRLFGTGWDPLPITLTSFTGRQEGDDVTLGWSTASEENSNYFRVLQSSDME